MNCMRKLIKFNTRRFRFCLLGLAALFLCLYGITQIGISRSWCQLRIEQDKRVHDVVRRVDDLVRNTTILSGSTSSFRTVRYPTETQPCTHQHHTTARPDTNKQGHQLPTILRNPPMRRVHDVSCMAILEGDANEIKKANNLMRAKNFTRLRRLSDDDYIQQTKDCDSFRKSRGYFTHNITEHETDFSIAYSILLYKEVEQAERLLRAIYHPNNHYCIHVDADAPTVVHDAIEGIAKCLQNVFVVSRKEFVIYAGFTRLQADLNCMEALLRIQGDWKYFMNLPSQNFPTKTNSEIVQILKLYNGTNDISGTKSNTFMERHGLIYKYLNKGLHEKATIKKTSMKKDNPPFNVTVVKGSAYGTFSRAFVKFIVGSRVARVLLDWMRDIYSPDEYYWSTLQYNPQIGTPGGYTGIPEYKPHLTTHVTWYGGPCAGKIVRFVCVFGVGDLSSLVQKRELFINKLHLDYQPYALDCMEEWHLNRTANGAETLNMTYYKKLLVKK